MSWERARSWSYITQLGLEEGFQANGVEYLTIPAIQEFPSSAPESWLRYARDLCSGKHFDQVWLEIVHSNLDETFLEWLATVAPIRIGIIPESLTYYPDEYEFVPHLKKRKELIESRYPYLTHVLAGDERDAEDINARYLTRGFWWPAAIPERFIFEKSEAIPTGHAIFCGAIYGNRAACFEHPDLKGLLSLKISPENSTEYPKLFDKLNKTYSCLLKSGLSVTEETLSTYLSLLRSIRQDAFRLYLEGYRCGSAVVNLPHFVKSYAGRVVEGMAAGRPVVSWEIPDRPRNKMLFEDGMEILLYPKDDASVLASHIRRIRELYETTMAVIPSSGLRQ